MNRDQIITAINRSKENPGTLEEKFWNAKLRRLAATPEDAANIDNIFHLAIDGEQSPETAADEILTIIRVDQ